MQAAVVSYPATDLTSMTTTSPELREAVDGFFGDAHREASPITNVSAACPPVLTVTGADDSLTTAALCRQFHRALDDAGVKNRLEIIEGRDHAFDLQPGGWEITFALMIAFLAETLGSPDPPPPVSSSIR